MEVKLGTVVQDGITGFTGVAMARTVYYYGVPRVFVEPRVLRNDKPVGGEWIDEGRLIEAEDSSIARRP
ncbi:MAG TPA: hypothetical protein VM537_03325 [Anaerolineae bacterium]|nr:hypothetical protein [Anaerolineae bacterium]